MTDNPSDPYPEHTKLGKISEESQTIGEFLDGSPYVLAEYVTFEGNDRETLVPVQKPIQQILADWFGIDLDAIEREKRQMLESMRQMSNSSGDEATGD